MPVRNFLASIDPFRVWIRAAAAYSTLVRQSKCHQACQISSLHQGNKHIELHMQFIRNLVHDSVIDVLYCPTDDQVADIFTKSLIEAKFSKLWSMLGVQEFVLKGG